jgi:hypothetical protein
MKNTFLILVATCALLHGGCSKKDANSEHAIMDAFIRNTFHIGESIDEGSSRLEALFQKRTPIEPRFSFILDRYILVLPDDGKPVVNLGTKGFDQILLLPINLKGQKALPIVRRDLKIIDTPTAFLASPLILTATQKNEAETTNH